MTMTEVTTRIKFDENALYTLILSAVEVYKKEVLGLVLGHKYGDLWFIKLALPLVFADNAYTHVNWIQNRVERLKDFRALLTKKYSFLGFYHSHTDYANYEAEPTPSQADIDSFMSDKDAEIEIIIAIKQSDRSRDIWELEDGLFLDRLLDHLLDFTLKSQDM